MSVAVLLTVGRRATLTDTALTETTDAVADEADGGGANKGRADEAAAAELTKAAGAALIEAGEMELIYQAFSLDGLEVGDTGGGGEDDGGLLRATREQLQADPCSGNERCELLWPCLLYT